MPRLPRTLLLSLVLVVAACGPQTDLAGQAVWAGKGDGEQTCQLVKGSFELYYQGDNGHVGSTPDGDSVWFRPDSRNLLLDLGAGFNRSGKGDYSQLRFRSIDALELHYNGRHQHLALARGARDALVSLLGFTEVVYAPETYTSVRSSVPTSTRGYLLVTGVDRYRRALVYVFAGDAAEVDGVVVACDPARIANESVNAELLRQGMAYPSFYSDVPDEIRLALTAVAQQARASQRGVWALDRSFSEGLSPDALATLDDQVMMPMIYRRLNAYQRDRERKAEKYGAMSFFEYLEATNRDNPLVVVPLGGAEASGTSQTISDIVELTPVPGDGRAPGGDHLRLRVLPEQIVMQ